MYISHICETSVFDHETMKNVLHVSDFKFSLLSVSRIIREFSCFVSFYPDFCVFRDPFDGKVNKIGGEDKILYIFKGEVPTQHMQGFTCDKQVITAGTILQDVNLWHKRLDHPSTKVLKLLNLVQRIKDSEVLCKYSICPLTKQTRLVFPVSSSRASICFVVVHIDLWDLIRPLLWIRFLTIIDGFSRFV